MIGKINKNKSIILEKHNEISIGNNFKSIFKDGEWKYEYIDKSIKSEIIKNNIKTEYKEKPEYKLLEQLETAEVFIFSELLKNQNKELLSFINKNINFNDIN